MRAAGAVGGPRATRAGPGPGTRLGWLPTALRAAASAFALLAASGARADETMPAGSTEPRAVVFVVPAEGSGAGAAREAMDAIRAQLGDVPVRVVVEPPPGGVAQPGVRERIEAATALARRHGAIGAFWLDTEPGGGDVVLYLVEPAGRRVLVRRVQSSGAAQASLEEVGVIARSTVGALLEGGEIGMEVVEPPAPPPARAPPPRPPSPPPPPRRAAEPAREAALWLGAGYVGTNYAAQVPWQSGVGLAVALSPRRSFYLAAGYTFYLAAEVDTPSVSMRVLRHPMEAAVGWEVPFDDFSLAAELAAIADYTTRTTTRVAPGFRSTPESTGWDAGLSPRVRLALAFLPSLRVSAGVGVDVILNGQSYEVATESDPILDPGTLRARVDLGIAVDAL